MGRRSIKSRYGNFLHLCIRTVVQRPWLFLGFVLLAIAAAVTEGIGIGLLIPLLNQGAGVDTGGRLPLLDFGLSVFMPSDAGERVIVLAAILALIIILRGILQISASYLAIILPLSLQKKMSAASFESLLTIGLDFFLRADGGVMRTLVQEYPERLASAIKAATDAISNTVLALIYGIIMLSLSWRMTVITIVLMGLSSFAIKRTLTMPLARNGMALSIAQENWNTVIYETGLGLKLIRLLGAERMVRESFRESMERFFRYETFRHLIAEAQSPLMTTIGGLFVCGMLIYSSLVATQLNTASILVLVLCLYRLTAPVSRIMTNIVIIDANLDPLERQESFQKSAADNFQHNGSRRFTRLVSSLSFHGVKFTYPGSDSPALNNFDLTIKRGEMIALVGPSGSGKSTVVNLIGRLYDPNSGAIEVDGVNLRDLEISSWREKIAIVSQDMTLFNTSVAKNVTFGQVGISQKLLEEAAVQASALEFIQNLPDSWNTNLGDRGVRLSGGQQQRLSIARAFLRDPEFLILDEATSQLDTITERTIQRMVDSFREKRTIVVVAHRLSTVRRADRIIVMQNGRVIESGSHHDLVNQGGHYRAMLDAQEFDLQIDESEQELEKIT